MGAFKEGVATATTVVAALTLLVSLLTYPGNPGKAALESGAVAVVMVGVRIRGKEFWKQNSGFCWIVILSAVGIAILSLFTLASHSVLKEVLQ